jgi:mycoketide-CoA synthase
MVRTSEERDSDNVAEPIAIIGMACRYPGGIASPEDLWEFVAAECCAAAEMPTDRGWNLTRLFHPDQTLPGRSSSRYGGGFMSDAMMFDAEFFGISPRDAAAMNPVQRLLLTVAWEVFEHAGIVPDTVRGQDIGTFIGILSPEYGPLWHEAPADVEGKLMTGTLDSAASGRLSHFFGVSGPCITVDTGCSASLVGAHLAAQSLRSGECSMALVGGASFHATPGQFTEFTRQGALSSDGKCRAFAESADGTSWSEGAGMLLLARLSDAQRDGHRVLAVIRGSAVNHDGDGTRFTVPNGDAHQRLIRRALADADLAAHEVDAVDAHGTGTRVGDPIEAAGILATYGQRSQSDRPLRLGSLKSNIGHATAAAGVGSVIKMVQAMHHDMLPRTLHVDAPSSRIDWSSGSVRLLTEAIAWPGGDRPRRAAVSSFGVGGTNAHTILEEAPLTALPPVPVGDRDQTGVVPWMLSGRTDQALRDQASALRRHLARRRCGPERPEEEPGNPALAARPELSVADVGYSLATSRARFEHRAAIIASSVGDFVAGLDAIEAGAFADSVVSAVATAPDGVAFVFPGQGSQWPGMATALAAASPVFAAELNRCANALAPYCDWSLLDVLHGVSGAPSLDRADVVQPALFAVMVALARTWMRYGVRPTCVIGHSQGEIAAACVAGALSLPDAAKVVSLRSRALRRLSGDYGMASVALPAERVRPLLGDGMSIAVDNGPRAAVIAGPRDALDELVADLTAKDERARMLPVDYASHSVQVESIRAQLLTELAGITSRTSQIPFYSTVTGELLDTTTLTAEYWYTNLRQTVRFDTAIRTALGAGVRHFVEASPHPLLLNAIEQIATDAGVSDVAVVGSLQRDAAGMDAIVRNLGQAFVCGLPVDGAALFDGVGARRVDLPTYRFQNRKFWLGNGSVTADLVSHGLGATGHPLLGAAISLADGGVVLSGTLSTLSHSWLADHGVHGLVVVPGAALVEMVVQAADQVGCGFVEELVLAAPLVLTDDHAVAVQVVIGACDDTAQRKVSIHSRPSTAQNSVAGGGWIRHASGVVSPVEHSQQVGVDIGADAWPPAGANPIDIGDFNSQLAQVGYAYGDAFQGMRAIWRRDADLFAEVALPDGVRADAGRFTLHPALLDAALRLMLVNVIASGQVRIPFSVNRMQVHGSGASALRVRVTAQGEEFSVSAVEPTGQPVLSIGAFALRPVSSGQLAAGRPSAADSLLRIRWSPIAVPSGVQNLPADVTVHRCEETDPRRAAAWALASVQSFLRDDSAGPARLVLVTRGAMVCDPADDVDVAQAAVWGLMRAARSEHPGRFVLVDVDGHNSSAMMLPAALTVDEPELAIRGDIVSVPRLVRVAGEGRGLALPHALDPDGAVLITGGTGVLGGLLARHLVTEYNVKNLVLTSRRGPATPGSAELVAELTELGAQVRVVACDIADRVQAQTLLAEIGAGLTGVVHAAGVLDDGTVEALTAERLDVVFRPKVDGATQLDELTRHLDLALFVLFSSAAGTIGTQGQANYAAANTAMDAIAIRRRAAGLPAQSLAWGFWQSASGLTGHLNDNDRGRLTRAGVLPMPTEDGLALFDAAYADGGVALVTAKLNLNSQGNGGSPLLRGPTRPQQRAASGNGRTTPNAESLVSRLAGMAAPERTSTLAAIVRSHTAAVLGHADPGAIGRDRAFKELGLDSLSAVELRNRLGAETGLRLSPTVVFDHSSPVRLAEHLITLIVPGHESRQGRDTSTALPQTAAVASQDQIDDMDIEALVAMVNTGSIELERESR